MDSLNIHRFGTVLGRLLVAVLAALLLGAVPSCQPWPLALARGRQQET